MLGKSRTHNSKRKRIGDGRVCGSLQNDCKDESDLLILSFECLNEDNFEEVIHLDLTCSIPSSPSYLPTPVDSAGEHRSFSDDATSAIIVEQTDDALDNSVGHQLNSPKHMASHPVEDIQHQMTQRESCSLTFVSPMERSMKNHGLGTWKFDTKKRKKYYISLMGRKLEGGAAVKQCREDQQYLQNPSMSARPELRKRMRCAPTCLTDVPTDSDPLSLSTWGLPPCTVRRYESMGVCRLFDWQLQCLVSGSGNAIRQDPNPAENRTDIATSSGNTLPRKDVSVRSCLHGGNLVYSAPTSGGKTLVSELLMLRALAVRGGLTLFVVPFVSLAEEKAAYFQTVWADLHVGVRAMHGDDGGAEMTDDLDVAVCTIERANVIVTQLLEAGQESRISLIVVDEVHLIGDSNRGFLLEVMLSKVMFTSAHSTQIIAMSATLPNIRDLATWIGASLFTTDYRPVDLNTMVCFGKKLHTVRCMAGGGGAEFVSMESSGGNYIDSVEGDPDGLLGLVANTCRKGKSVLLFCPSKRRCETVAQRVAKMYSDQPVALTSRGVAKGNGPTSTLSSVPRVVPEAVGARKEEVQGKEEGSVVVAAGDGDGSLTRRRLQVLAELRQSPVGLCPVLRSTIPYGVAYHHAGLCVDERKVLENAFRKGSLSVLVATSTLAAGVNLPAHRVIIRDPTMGSEELSVASFRQMCGRAGRMLLDTQGEAVLMVEDKAPARRLGLRLCSEPLAPLTSTLQAASGGGLEKLLLEMVCCRRLSRVEEVPAFTSCTLMAVQRSSAETQGWTDRAVQFLVDNQFVVHTSEVLRQEGETGMDPSAAALSNLVATPLGRATALSGIAPRDALPVLSSLQRARVRLVLRSSLHPIFLCTPPDPCIEPRWAEFESILNALLADHEDVRSVLLHLGADFAELLRLKNSPPKYGCDKPRTRFYRRLYSAVILFSLVQEVPLNRVAKLLDAKRGQLQQLQKDSAAFCGMAIVFCRTLNWESLASVLESFIKRLSTGVRPELLPLVRLGPEMPSFRARAFLRCGLSSPAEILKTDTNDLIQILFDCMPFSGKDPLTARVGVGGNARDQPHCADSADTQQHLVCAALAMRIKMRCKEVMQEELLAAAKEAAAVFN